MEQCAFSGPFTEAHGLLIQILKWALTNRYMRPTRGRIVDQVVFDLSGTREDASVLELVGSPRKSHPR